MGDVTVGPPPTPEQTAMTGNPVEQPKTLPPAKERSTTRRGQPEPEASSESTSASETAAPAKKATKRASKRRG